MGSAKRTIKAALGDDETFLKELKALGKKHNTTARSRTSLMASRS